ncbi:BolA domain-containing protein [Microsporum canis CBS 113480]|uniref:BolA domain-containing protein n=1 Tax=Arthroderma otae (strain ATCC MYA-4605 / CBS 113480) TaxID=554155 RepID=C5FG09_ARTOC|nr:BolA domain-containing protein [Microsporum canis CBS 113480]EEQ29694.1 BolA domain-containing protein [Microsporum canis CBS 113480]
MAASTSASQTPLEDAIREKARKSRVTKELSPITLTIRNDSKLHAHHAPMQGNTSTETHFSVTIVSSAFASKNQPARHRMVYNLLKEEMARDGGIHALQLKTRTPEEEERASRQQES